MSAFTISRNRVSYHVSFPLSYYYCFTWFYTRNKKRLDHKRWTHHHSTHAFSTRSKTYDTQTYASAGVRGDRRGTNVKLTPRINDVIIDRRSKARGSKRATVCTERVERDSRDVRDKETAISLEPRVSSCGMIYHLSLSKELVVTRSTVTLLPRHEFFDANRLHARGDSIVAGDMSRTIKQSVANKCHSRWGNYVR